jgi:Xaa-Pro aminopeptidase
MELFEKEIYKNRRNQLKSKINSGIGIFPGNNEVAYNYPGNTFHFRQDSTFSYFFGLNEPEFVGIIDFETGDEFLFGNDIDMEDIIWMGFLPSVKERGMLVGITETKNLKELAGYVTQAQAKGRKIHYLTTYRNDIMEFLCKLLNKKAEEIKDEISLSLTREVIALREIKRPEEIQEIERMIDVAYDMHTTAMKMAQPGVNEKTIAGIIEGIALSGGHGVSFPVILSMNGEILHNHRHNQTLETGRLMVVDAGSESDLLYASDITRTTPVGGKFSTMQKEIYQLVLNANLNTIQKAGPCKFYKEMHLQAAEIIAEGLKAIGLMKGDIKEAVAVGAHALFFPHGLGHALGMDVHDMEGLGEDNVGYDSTVSRSEQFGLAYLRFAKKPKPGTVLTVEPGIYFIPALIDKWCSEKMFTDFINYDKLESFKTFGGIRIEDNILITEKGCQLLGKPIPKTVEEVENTVISSK